MNDLQLLLQTTFEALQAGQSLDLGTSDQLISVEIPTPQSIAICTRLTDKERTSIEDALLDSLSGALPEPDQRLLATWSQSLASTKTTQSADVPVDTSGNLENVILQRIARKESIGRENLSELMHRLVSNQTSNSAMAAILTAIVLKGLSDLDQHYLTQAIVATGTVIDLREAAILSGRRLIRRYPTGGVSEKIALVLPTVISHLAKFYPVAGTFLVGRTMGFTGGTWDKLSVIPGFAFPTSADEIATILQSVHVAMCTTSRFVAPADRQLYSLRSETGTVQSLPLICSSIASKHLALPAHEILFDVRFGSASFAETIDVGRAIADGIASEFRDTDIKVRCVLQSTTKMNGSSIGNVVELAEALATMGAKSSMLKFDSRGIQTQRELVASQAASLLSGATNESDICGQVIDLLDSGQLLKAFAEMAAHHCADRSAIESMCSDPASLVGDLEKIACSARKSGKLVHVDQKAIGRFVNFAFRDDRSNVPGKHRTGFVLGKWPNDKVNVGDLLGTCYVSKQDREKAIDLLGQLAEEWFEIN